MMQEKYRVLRKDFVYYAKTNSEYVELTNKLKKTKDFLKQQEILEQRA
jgi:hypothetical protein